MHTTGQYIQCETEPDTIAVSVDRQSFSLIIKPLFNDIVFGDIDITGAPSGIDVSIPEGSGTGDLTEEYQKVFVTMSTGWESKSYRPLFWSFSSQITLQKGNSLRFSFKEICCNGMEGIVNITVTLHAYIILNNGCQAVVETISVPLYKEVIRQPEITEFSAVEIKRSTDLFEVETEGFITPASIETLFSVPVGLRPYVCPGPEPGPAPTPVEKKRVRINWNTTNAKYWYLSVGGNLNGACGSQIIEMPKNTVKITLTVLSLNKVLKAERETVIQ